MKNKRNVTRNSAKVDVINDELEIEITRVCVGVSSCARVSAGFPSNAGKQVEK